MQLSVFVVAVLCTLSLAQATRFGEVPFPNVTRLGLGVLPGPESIAFDSKGLLYTGIADGSIRRVNTTTGEVSLFVRMADNANVSLCGTPAYEAICGRPLGMVFDDEDNLYVADAYLGIFKIDTNGVKTLLADSYQGVRFKFANGVALTSDKRTLYFTDSSQLYSRAEFVKVVIENKPDGRLFRIDLTNNNNLRLLLSGMRFPNGIALSKDESFLVINQCSDKKLTKYNIRWGVATDFVSNIGGYPDNIRPDGNGNFWVGMFAKTSKDIDTIQASANLQRIFLTYVPPTEAIGLAGRMGVIKKVDYRGRVVKSVVDNNGTQVSYVAEAEPHHGKMYLGSVILPYIAVFNLSDLQ